MTRPPCAAPKARCGVRPSLRGQRGQALPLAAVGIFIMALAVLATLNLGQAVHAKIKLQNTADSAAYTLAAMEARTFNYIAFLNRTQVAHYNTAMAVQSLISYVGYQLSVFNATVDILMNLQMAFAKGLTWECVKMVGRGCPFELTAAVTVPALAEAVAEGKTLSAGVMGQFAYLCLDGHAMVEAMAILNARALWQSQFARAVLLNAHLLTGMQAYIEKLDPDLSFTGGGKAAMINTTVNAALNSIEYYQTFDASAGLNPFIFTAIRDMPKLMANQYFIKSLTGAVGGAIGGTAGSVIDKGTSAASKVKGGGVPEALKVMTEISNASRSPLFVTDRFTFEYVTIARPPVWASLLGPKMGQTKLVEDGAMVGAMIPAIHTPTITGTPAAKYLASDDFLPLGQASAIGMAFPATVVSYKNPQPLGDAIAAYSTIPGIPSGKHRHYVGTIPGVLMSDAALLTWPKPDKNLGGKTTTLPEAGWPGFAAYFKFKPISKRSSDFNQPSTWIFLNKPTDQVQDTSGSLGSSSSPFYANFSFTHGRKTGTLDTNFEGFLFDGITVLSRGMAYYHRPGTWAEHPNFFNPFWRARLAPIGQKLQNFWEEFVGSNIMASAGAGKVMQGAMNFLRNAQMDLMTSVITSLVTH